MHAETLNDSCAYTLQRTACVWFHEWQEEARILGKSPGFVPSRKFGVRIKVGGRRALRLYPRPPATSPHHQQRRRL